VSGTFLPSGGTGDTRGKLIPDAVRRPAPHLKSARQAARRCAQQMPSRAARAPIWPHHPRPPTCRAIWQHHLQLHPAVLLRQHKVQITAAGGLVEHACAFRSTTLGVLECGWRCRSRGRKRLRLATACLALRLAAQAFIHHNLKPASLEGEQTQHAQCTECTPYQCCTATGRMTHLPAGAGPGAASSHPGCCRRPGWGRSPAGCPHR